MINRKLDQMTHKKKTTTEMMSIKLCASILARAVICSLRVFDGPFPGDLIVLLPIGFVQFGDVGHERGVGSVSREQIDSSTLEMVSAGDQLSFRMSRQIP